MTAVSEKQWQKTYQNLSKDSEQDMDVELDLDLGSWKENREDYINVRIVKLLKQKDYQLVFGNVKNVSLSLPVKRTVFN